VNFRRARTEEVEINLTPLIDVVFLLLIFFMVSTTFTKETRLAITLPEADGLVAEEQAKPVEVVVGAEGDYVVNGERLVKNDAQTLRAVLSNLTESSEYSLIITADANARHQAVVTLMDVAGQLGYVNLSITTREPIQE